MTLAPGLSFSFLPRSAQVAFTIPENEPSEGVRPPCVGHFAHSLAHSFCVLASPGTAQLGHCKLENPLPRSLPPALSPGVKFPFFDFIKFSSPVRVLHSVPTSDSPDRSPP